MLKAKNGKTLGWCVTNISKRKRNIEIKDLVSNSNKQGYRLELLKTLTGNLIKMGKICYYTKQRDIDEDETLFEAAGYEPYKEVSERSPTKCFI